MSRALLVSEAAEAEGEPFAPRNDACRCGSFGQYFAPVKYAPTFGSVCLYLARTVVSLMSNSRFEGSLINRGAICDFAVGSDSLRKIHKSISRCAQGGVYVVNWSSFGNLTWYSRYIDGKN